MKLPYEVSLKRGFSQSSIFFFFFVKLKLGTVHSCVFSFKEKPAANSSLGSVPRVFLSPCTLFIETPQFVFDF